MKNRPTSVTIISWVLMVTAGISLVVSVTSLNNPMVLDLMSKSPIPLNIQYVLLFLGLSISAGTGFFMLHGRGWARNLYVGWSFVGFTISLATAPMKLTLIPGFVVFLVIVFFLFRPAARLYFSSDSNTHGSQGI